MKPNSVFLIVAAFLLIAAGRMSTAQSPELKQDTPVRQQSGQLVIPKGRAYAGAYIDFGEREDTVTLEQIERFDNMVGKQQAIVAFSSDWGNDSFPDQQLKIISNYGAIPLIFWSPWDRPVDQHIPPEKNVRFSLNAILAGQWDGYIDLWATRAREYGKPLLVSWGLEMNGEWFPWSGAFYGRDKPVAGCTGCFAGPETFKKAYRYVVDRVRARGAANILWVWHPNNTSSPDEPWNAMAHYYPGPQYADWLAISAYGTQFAGQDWVSFDDAVSLRYPALSQVDPDKPLMLGEWGIGEFPKKGSKAQWMAEFFERIPKDFPRIHAVVFWHERWHNADQTISNLRVNSSAEALEAYRNGIANSFWLARPIFAP